MGVGNYGENDIREAARAFTGWNYRDLEFVINREQHDSDTKTVLGRSGGFDGVEVIDIIMQQPATADYIAGKLYRHFVRDDLQPALQRHLGTVLRDAGYELAPFLETLFLSRDFYDAASMGTQIRSPVQLVVSSCRKLGLREVPGVPDFNETTTALGQQLFHPPTVAGWAGGRSWITPGLLLARGNFARDLLFPDINFIPPDRYSPNEEIRQVADRIRAGQDITSATTPAVAGKSGMTAESNRLADRDEDFNTRFGSFRGWQMALERVRPIPRDVAPVDLSAMVKAQGLEDTRAVVDHFIARFMVVPPDPRARLGMIAYLDEALGTTDIARAATYMEDALRTLLHLVMSQPEYQLC